MRASTGTIAFTAAVISVLLLLAAAALVIALFVARPLAAAALQGVWLHAARRSPINPTLKSRETGPGAVAPRPVRLALIIYYLGTRVF